MAVVGYIYITEKRFRVDILTFINDRWETQHVGFAERLNDIPALGDKAKQIASSATDQDGKHRKLAISREIESLDVLQER